MKDEAKTRIDIDTLLQHCGFVLQDKGEFNRFAIYNFKILKDIISAFNYKK